MSSNAMLRLDLSPEPSAAAVARSFASAVARSCGASERAVEDLRIAVTSLVGHVPGGSPIVLTAEIADDRLVLLVPVGDDGPGRAGLLSALSIDVDASPDGATVRLVVPVER